MKSLEICENFHRFFTISSHFDQKNVHPTLQNEIFQAKSFVIAHVSKIYMRRAEVCTHVCTCTYACSCTHAAHVDPSFLARFSETILF